MNPVIARGQFGLSLNQRAKTADNRPYRSLFLPNPVTSVVSQ